jgi:hypothetical protein
LPATTDGELRYRTRSEHEAFERVAKKGQLTPDSETPLALVIQFAQNGFDASNPASLRDKPITASTLPRGLKELLIEAASTFLKTPIDRCVIA